MPDETGVHDESAGGDRRVQHRVAMACGALLGLAVFSYLAIAQNIVRGVPYGPFWWTNLALGVVVFACVGGLAMVLVYMTVRRDNVAKGP